MAKRFTDTEKWDDPWFTALPDRLKLFWLYICDKADLAGVWKVHKGLAETYLGGKVDLEAALAAFTTKRIEVFNEGERWRIKRFIEFQYGNLHENSPMAKAVAKAQSSYPIDTPSIPYQYPIDTPLVMVKVQDKDKVKGFSYPPEFENIWTIYPRKSAKGSAVASWEKLTPEEQATLAGAILWQLKSREHLLRDDPSKVPHLATWINQRRFDDSPTTKAPTKTKGTTATCHDCHRDLQGSTSDTWTCCGAKRCWNCTVKHDQALGQGHDQGAA